LNGQLATSHPSSARKSPETLDLDYIEDIILGIDFEGASFEAAYADVCGALLATGIVRAHELTLQTREEAHVLAAGSWPGPHDASFTSFSLETAAMTGVIGKGGLDWRVRRGPRFQEATRRILPLVVRLLSMKWAVASFEAGMPRVLRESDTRASDGRLYRAFRGLSPTMSASELLDAIARSSAKIASYEALYLVLHDDRINHRVFVPRSPMESSEIQKLVARLEAAPFHASGLVETEHEALDRVLEPLDPNRPSTEGDLEVGFEIQLCSPGREQEGSIPLGRVVLLRSATVPLMEAERVALVQFIEDLRRLLEDRRVYQELERQAKTDSMTDLYNYRTFRTLLSQEFSRSRRHGTPVSLLILDVDRFKSINDSLGHQKGDETLKGLASIMLETKRKEDMVARYGGEEFVLILPQVGREGALHLAERLRHAVATGGLIPERTVTVSVGVATLDPETDLTEDQLIFLADAALGSAKRRGRNRVEVAGSPLKLVEPAS